MKLTTKQAWLTIAHSFEKFYELDHQRLLCSDLTSTGLCNAVGRVNTDSKTCMQMNKHLRAFVNYEKPLSQFWFYCEREEADKRALIAYFLAEMGDELL